MGILASTPAERQVDAIGVVGCDEMKWCRDESWSVVCVHITRVWKIELAPNEAALASARTTRTQSSE